MMQRRGSIYLTKSALTFCLLVVCCLQQGCLAAAWVAAVGADSLRASDIEFRPFEQSWVSSEMSGEIVDRPSLTSVALLPVQGDAAMGARLLQILQRQTALRVVTAKKLNWPAAGLADDERAELTRKMAGELDVDAVLFWRVVNGTSRASEWGWKDEETRRLFLYLVARDGHLLWKDELPFVIVTGAKPPNEDAVQRSFAHHLLNHVRHLGLDGLGYLPPKPS
jgi:hypothetical protein